MTITMDMFTTRKAYTPKHIIPPCKECTPMHTHSITHPMLRAISTIRGTQPTLMSLIHEEHDLHTTMHYAYTHIPTYMEQVAAQWPITNPLMQYTPTKEYIPMHYKLTLTTRTTMAWVIMCTIATLLWWGAALYLPVPEWGGIHTITRVSMFMSLGCTTMAALAHGYVRRHGPVVLSTRDLGL